MATAKPAAPAKQKQTTQIVVKAPNFRVLELVIVGTAPYVSNNGEWEQMAKDHAKGEVELDKESVGAKKPPKDFDRLFQVSMHHDTDGKVGYLPATGLRQGMVRAGYNTGIDMTVTKAAIFVLADAYNTEGSPLVKITKGQPEPFKGYAMNRGGSPDIRCRARWAAGWEAKVRIRYDADLMNEQTVANLLHRAGVTIGIGAGRPFSKMSCGQGWGTFEVKANRKEVAA